MAVRKIRFFLGYGLKALFYFPYILCYRHKKIIIICSCDLETYNGNSRYLFEYLSQHTDENVYWVTRSKDVMQYLKAKKLKYLFKVWTIKSLLYTYSSKIIVGSGLGFHDPFELVRKKAIKICVNHGPGPKTVKTMYDTYKENIIEIKKYQLFDFVNFPSDYLAHNAGRKVFLLSKSQVLNLGNPRDDQFFCHDKIVLDYKNKKTLSYLLDGFRYKNQKIILYTPTWRPYSYALPLLNLPGLSLEKLNNFLIENNILFFTTKHSMSTADTVLDNMSNIIFIDNQKKPLFDITAFMMEVDVLINDYSTTTTDFCLLGRPQIFVMPDYEKYNHEKGFLEDYKSVIPGKEASSFEELLSLINLYITKPEFYQRDYSEKIKSYLEKYYDSKCGDSCERFAELIDKIISQ